MGEIVQTGGGRKIFVPPAGLRQRPYVPAVLGCLDRLIGFITPREVIGGETM